MPSSMHNALATIFDFHRDRANRDGRDPEAVFAQACAARTPINVGRALSVSNGVSLIAEVKRASPSEGQIAQIDSVATLAQAYLRGGAICISVLTDEPHFNGSVADLVDVRRAQENAPILRKDFTVDVRDIYDTRVMGADAALLIVAGMSDRELSTLLEAAQRCGVSILCETHDSDEVQRALDCGATMIGVNQRDLRTFTLDYTKAIAMRDRIPDTHVAVAESGVRNAEDVRRFLEVGFDAALVGTSLLRAENPEEAVRKLVEAGEGR